MPSQPIKNRLPTALSAQCKFQLASSVELCVVEVAGAAPNLAAACTVACQMRADLGGSHVSLSLRVA